MTQNHHQQQSSANKISSYLLFIVLIVIGLSVIALISAIWAYTIERIVEAGFLIIIGAFALALSCVILYQTRRGTAAMKIEAPKVMTYIECKGCNTKITRDFQRGDFVFKELDTCPNCPEQKQMITGVYKEIKEKEKTYAV
jgi:hypothetical protein